MDQYECSCDGLFSSITRFKYANSPKMAASQFFDEFKLPKGEYIVKIFCKEKNTTIFFKFSPQFLIEYNENI